MSWYITQGRGVGIHLPKQVAVKLRLLMAAIEVKGPVRGEWPNYGKLGSGKHHCHMKKGRPAYVAVWKEMGKAKLRDKSGQDFIKDSETGAVLLVDWVEVIYAGTHEKAPY